MRFGVSFEQRVMAAAGVQPSGVTCGHCGHQDHYHRHSSCYAVLGCECPGWEKQHTYPDPNSSMGFILLWDALRAKDWWSIRFFDDDQGRCGVEMEREPDQEIYVWGCDTRAAALLEAAAKAEGVIRG